MGVWSPSTSEAGANEWANSTNDYFLRQREAPTDGKASSAMYAGLAGFLCEEMGLGKTCEMCALMLANKHSAAAVAAGRARKMRPGTYPPTPLPDVAATLVVVPQTLLTQWEAEVRKCTGAEAEGGLRVYQFHGPDRPSTGAAFEKAITGADVVLTTYAGHAST
jgi:SNF2 family DNA or RNA helicase